MIEDGIIRKLLDTAGVTSLAANRIYPGRRPQGASLPAIVINRVSGAPLYADEGEVGLESARIQIDCWAETWSGAKMLAREVLASLSAFYGTVQTTPPTVFQLIELEAERDLQESGTDQRAYPFRTSMDFDVWAERP